MEESPTGDLGSQCEDCRGRRRCGRPRRRHKVALPDIGPLAQVTRRAHAGGRWRDRDWRGVSGPAVLLPPRHLPTSDRRLAGFPHADKYATIEDADV